MVVSRLAMRTAMRAACVELLQGVAADTSSGPLDGALQIYPTIPTSIRTPCGFVERLSGEVETFPGPTQRQRVVTASVIILWRTFLGGERGDAVAQADAFADALADWVLYHRHAPGPTEIIESVRIEEDPYYVLNDPERGNVTYLATRFTMEGYTAN